ncbi:MAG TPA: hypothetical protein VM529_25900 [Gemmata sp.]|nr:hypothetical protein [Gemmata sp.]
MGKRIVRVSQELFAQWFIKGNTFPAKDGERIRVAEGLPPGARLVSCNLHAYWEYDQIGLLFESAHWPDVRPGDAIPEIVVRYEVETLADLPAADQCDAPVVMTHSAVTPEVVEKLRAALEQRHAGPGLDAATSRGYADVVKDVDFNAGEAATREVFAKYVRDEITRSFAPEIVAALYPPPDGTLGKLAELYAEGCAADEWAGRDYAAPYGLKPREVRGLWAWDNWGVWSTESERSLSGHLFDRLEGGRLSDAGTVRYYPSEAAAFAALGRAAANTDDGTPPDEPDEPHVVTT